MERRRERRLRRRLACELDVAGRHHGGVVRDLSTRGLFVQTLARPARGSDVAVRLRGPAWRRPLLLQTIPVRLFVVPPPLLAAAGGGVGLRIVYAPDRYVTFVEEQSRRLRHAGIGSMRRPQAPWTEESLAGFDPFETDLEIEIVSTEDSEQKELPLAGDDEPERVLPPIHQPSRPRCKTCQRSDRPLWNGVCAWCSVSR